MKVTIRGIGWVALAGSLALLGGNAMAQRRIAPAAGEAAPAALAGVVESGGVFSAPICGPERREGVARCFGWIVTDRDGRPLVGQGTSSPGARSASATVSGLTPSNLRSAYKITGQGTANQTIAIVDAYGYPNAEADLGVYRAQFGLPACTSANGCFTKYDQVAAHVTPGSQVYPAFDPGWAQETALDLQMASAICPGCKIILVEANDSAINNLAAAVDKAVARGAIAISNSYGATEGSWALGWNSHYNHPGVAITASTGDSGYGPQFPATSPNVVAVGGTHLTAASNARGWNETAWSLGGSGCSSVFARPAFQTPAMVPTALCPKRAEADIATVADPATGVAVYLPFSSSSAGWAVAGGTSASAPMIAAMFALHKAAYGDGIYDAASIYQGNGSGLFDITAGSNGTCTSGGMCNAGMGYDGPTGRGSPNGISRFGMCSPPSGGVPTC